MDVVWASHPCRGVQPATRAAENARIARCRISQVARVAQDSKERPGRRRGERDATDRVASTMPLQCSATVASTLRTDSLALARADGAFAVTGLTLGFFMVAGAVVPP